jgi:Ca2+/Na+ antiporter
MDSGLLVGRIFLSICIIAGIINLFKPNLFENNWHNYYKKYWKLSEDSIEKLRKISPYCNVIMLIIFIYLVITLDNYFPQP